VAIDQYGFSSPSQKAMYKAAIAPAKVFSENISSSLVGIPLSTAKRGATRY
jgi:hypothetical protein